MAKRRMISLEIIDTDTFLDIPKDSKLLYYELCIRADDDGFVASPKKIIKIVGCKNNGALSAGTSYGDYYSRSIYQNIILADGGISINGEPIEEFVVVAKTVDDLNAKKIVDFVKNKYNVDLSVIASSDYVCGDAIFVGVGNTYGGVRAGFDCDIDDDGDFTASAQEYLDADFDF
jgi:hypothetical protein